MTPTDNDVAVKVWEENRRLAREEQYNFCNSPRIWHNFYITVGLLIAVLSYVEWVHLAPLAFSGDGMAGAIVAGCDDDPYPGYDKPSTTIGRLKWGRNSLVKNAVSTNVG